MSPAGPDSPCAARRRLGLFLALGIVLSAAAAPAAPPGHGPVPISDYFVLGVGYLHLTPGSASILEPGRWELEVIASESNSHALSGPVETALQERSVRGPLTLEEVRNLEVAPRSGGNFLVDGELLRTTVRLRRGVRPGLQLELELPLLSSPGGFLDGLIEDFHAAVGVDQMGRLGLTRARYQVLLLNGDGPIEGPEEPGSGLGDLTLRVKQRLPALGSTTLALETSVKLPTGREASLYGSGSADAGVQLLATRCRRRTCWHGGFGVTYLGRYRRLRLGSQVVPQVSAAFQHRLAGRLSAIVQGSFARSPFRGLHLRRLGKNVVLTTQGLELELRRGTDLYLVVTENWFDINQSADLVFHLGFVQRF